MNVSVRAISFCELLHIFQQDTIDTVNVIPNAMKAAKFESMDRLYMGSNFCCRYFIKYIKSGMEKAAELLKSLAFHHVKITLCLPIFSQDYLEKGKTLVQEIVEKYPDLVDEITVNDFGMLAYVQQFKQCRINVGRLMNKDVRDVRYDEYFNAAHVPSVCTLQNAVYEKYNVCGYEFDIVNRFLRFGDFSANITVYAPYCFATMGNICEYAGVSNPIEKKFRANGPCTFTCANVNIEYTTPHDERYLKWGRAVFFKVDDYAVQTKNGYRLVYEPFDLFIRGGVKGE